MTSPSPRRRVLLVGWDAADWRVITPLLDAGHMPNLASLVEGGVCGRLATIQPPLSPMLWTSIATGKRAWKHGIHGFSEVEPGTGGLRPITSLSRSCKAVWNILHQAGKTSLVCGWWPSHPAEPIRGAMVSNHYQQAVAPLGEPWPMRPGTVHPPELAEELAGLRVHPHSIPGDTLRHFVPLAPEIDQEKDHRLDTVAKMLAECSGIHAAATHLMLEQPDWDFAAVYYDAIDHFSHGFMRYHPPRLPWVDEREFELYQGVVNAAYVFHDLMLGALLEIAGPETTVMVISDHGFHPDQMRPRQLPNEPAGPALEHGPYGILVAAGPGLRRDESLHGATLLDITPTLLALFGLPVGRDMDGGVLAGLFEQPPAPLHVDSWEDAPGDAGRHAAGSEAETLPPDPAHTLAALRQLEELGYIEEASGDARKAAEETVRELRYNLARALLDGGKQAWAREIFHELWEQWPEESRFGVHLLQAQIEAEMPLEARLTMTLLRERKAVAAEKAELQHRELLEKLEPEEAKRSETDFWEKVPEGDRRRLARLRARAGTNTLAFDFLEGCLLALEGRPEDALACLERAAGAQQTNRVSALLEMARVHAGRRRWEASAERCLRALELAPDDPVAYFLLARAHLALRRWATAAEAARTSLALRNFHPQAALLAGVALWRGGEKESAGHFLRRAIEMNPVFPAAQFFMSAYAREVLRDPALAREHRRLAREARHRVALIETGQIPAGLHRDEYRAAFGQEENIVAPRPARGLAPLPPLAQSVLIVSGLPRSGTSMMMQMLVAGGVPVLSDGRREADESNPRGYLEYEKAKAAHRDASWLGEAAGRAVKIVSPLLGQLPPPRPGLHYRVILMHRPLEEIERSQRRMLERQGRAPTNITPEAMRAMLRRQMTGALTAPSHWQAGGHLALLDVQYHSALADPLETARLLAWFLGLETDFDVNAAAGAVAAELRRERANVQ